MINKCFSFIVVIIVLNLCRETDALKCFACGPDERCDRSFEDQTVNCGFSPVPSQLRFACVKYHIGGSVVRNCFVDTFCENQPYCYACHTDYCNGADAKLVSKMSITLSTIFLLFFWFKC